jgi:hypothetical protein
VIERFWALKHQTPLNSADGSPIRSDQIASGVTPVPAVAASAEPEATIVIIEFWNEWYWKDCHNISLSDRFNYCLNTGRQTRDPRSFAQSFTIYFSKDTETA